MIIKANKPKRCAIYVFFDQYGVVDEYNYFILEELKKVLDRLIVICNGDVNEEGKKGFKSKDFVPFDQFQYVELKWKTQITNEIIILLTSKDELEVIRSLILLRQLKTFVNKLNLIEKLLIQLKLTKSDHKLKKYLYILAIILAFANSSYAMDESEYYDLETTSEYLQEQKFFNSKGEITERRVYNQKELINASIMMQNLYISIL